MHLTLYLINSEFRLTILNYKNLQMKYKLYYTICLFPLLVLGGCHKDFLNRTPQSQVDPDNYFKTATDLQLYTNSFYSYVPGSDIFSADGLSDNVECSNNSQVQGKMVVTTDAATAGWNWSTLRNINYFLERYQQANALDSVKAQYAGMARFFRAWFYFNMMKRFGDLPWYSTSLGNSSPELYKARDPRTLVTDSILSDLNYAIAHMGAVRSVSQVSRWTALALKSRVCLFEGTFRKYHTEFGLQDQAAGLLTAAYTSADSLMRLSGYKLFNTGTPQQDYLTLFSEDNASADEFILAQVYDAALSTYHAANGTFTVSTMSLPGFTKAFMDGFLMKDGTPFSAQTGYNTRTFLQETQNRDPRLAQIIRTPGYMRIGTTKKISPDFSVAQTGYQCIKFVTGTNQDGFNSNTNDLPVFRYAEVLLNFAEAKAELGILTQADLDRSFNLIRTRSGMPGMQLNSMAPDPLQAALYLHTTDPVIMEIRRERRIELAMEGFRYYDLIRWKEGHLLAVPYYGMYCAQKGEIDMDGDGIPDVAVVDQKPANPKAGVQYYILGSDHSLSQGDYGNMQIFPHLAKVFNENRDYLYPLPATELLLNPKLTQNPNWQ